MYMSFLRSLRRGWNRLFGRRSRGPPPPTPISIPNFNYPRNIFSYLMSQSKKYKITFTTPDGQSGNVTMPPNEPVPAETPSISSTAAPTSAPEVTTRPAFSTGLTTPPVSTTVQTVGSRRVLSTPYVSPGIPPFWVAAIWAMTFVDEIGPIEDYDTLLLFYNTVAEKIGQIMGDGSNGEKNVGALIYFCTVTSILFRPLTITNFTYNYLNVNFPKIFNDINNETNTISGSSNYTKFIMVNYYAKHAADIIKRNGYPRSSYIPTTEQYVIKYAVPTIMRGIVSLLKDRAALTGL
jgi:hypothetical protein